MVYASLGRVSYGASFRHHNATFTDDTSPRHRGARGIGSWAEPANLVECPWLSWQDHLDLN